MNQQIVVHDNMTEASRRRSERPRMPNNRALTETSPSKTQAA